MKLLSKLSLLLFITLCLSFSCQDDDITKLEPISGEVNLMLLAPGQVSKFVRLDGVCGWAENYEYTGDTLVLEVIELVNGMFFKETFTQGSPLFGQNPQPVTYPVSTSENQVIIPDRERSTLFFFYGSDVINTTPTHEINLIQEGCDQLYDGNPFIGDQIGFLPNLAIHDISLKNQTSVSCVPIIIDLKAFLVYQDGKLNMSYTLSSGFPGLTFQGWRLVE